MPTKPAAPVTRTVMPESERLRAERVTRRSQSRPPQESEPRFRRGEGGTEEGERRKKKRMKAKKKDDQRVSLDKEECNRRR